MLNSRCSYVEWVTFVMNWMRPTATATMTTNDDDGIMTMTKRMSAAETKVERRRARLHRMRWRGRCNAKVFYFHITTIRLHQVSQIVELQCQYNNNSNDAMILKTSSSSFFSLFIFIISALPQWKWWTIYLFNASDVFRPFSLSSLLWANMRARSAWYLSCVWRARLPVMLVDAVRACSLQQCPSCYTHTHARRSHCHRPPVRALARSHQRLPDDIVDVSLQKI